MKTVFKILISTVAILVAFQVWFQGIGGYPVMIQPSFTPIELQWRITHFKAKNKIYFIPASRVGWGFADNTFNQEIEKLYGDKYRALNTSMGSFTVPDVIPFIIRFHSGNPGVIVISYSPISFFWTPRGLDLPSSKLTRQEYLDERIKNFLWDYFYAYGLEYKLIKNIYYEAVEKRKVDDQTKKIVSGNQPFMFKIPYWHSRKIYPGGFVRATFAHADGSRPDPTGFQLDFHLRGIREDIRGRPKIAEEGRKRALGIIQDLKKSGWKIMLIHFPVGKQMYRIELNAPEHLKLPQFAASASVDYKDYNRDPRVRKLTIIDQSHLSPESANEFARILAKDIGKWIEKQDTPSK